MSYNRYFEEQAKNQLGGNLKVYTGTTYQNGYGLGGILNTLRKSFSWILPILKTHAVPLLKSGAESIGREMIKTA